MTNTNLTKEEYNEEKNKIEDEILKCFDKVNNVETLSIALFVYRAVTKKKMYEDDLKFWTIKFKMCNHLFFMCLEYLKNSKRTLYVSFNDYCPIRNLFVLGYAILKHQNEYNEQFFKENKKELDEFYSYMEQISNTKGDLHSYQILNANLRKYIESKNISEDKIRENALSQFSGPYICKSVLQNNTSWKQILNDNLSVVPNDDIISVPIYKLKKYNKKFCGFIEIFEARKCSNPSDPESDLFFSYRTKDFIFISKKILYDTQSAIETFITWGQYENVIKYFFGTTINQKILRNYNLLMTYKVVDLLISNKYIVPMNNWQRILIPRVEISNYVEDRKRRNELGDIDILFYSENTQILYIVEYKNYQMLVSRLGDLGADISKVERENTSEKVKKRQRYISDNVEKYVEMLFGKNII
ncbi:hypothetical protein [Filifactor villosus]|uniref:Uncharacterized protein n=1 Tax=Filifactor villosus TaxID=29374 RepID=A0ABV9QT45_9FIRM